MRIDVNHIPQEGETLKEEISPSELEVETELIKFHGNFKVRAQVSKITNAVIVDVDIRGLMYANCSRCLEEFQVDFKKNAKFNYLINNSIPFIDLNPDIRDEIVLDYPIKPLCSPDCKGLCIRCGKNLNEGGCNCGST